MGSLGLALSSLADSPTFNARSFSTLTLLKPEHKGKCKLGWWPCCWHGLAPQTRPPANPIRLQRRPHEGKALGAPQQEARAALPDMDHAA
jgi:hypothetical protein